MDSRYNFANNNTPITSDWEEYIPLDSMNLDLDSQDEWNDLEDASSEERIYQSELSESESSDTEYPLSQSDDSDRSNSDSSNSDATEESSSESCSTTEEYSADETYQELIDEQLEINENIRIREFAEMVFKAAEVDFDNSNYHFAIAKYITAIESLKALSALETKDYRELDAYYNNLSLAYQKLGDTSEALHAALDAFNMLSMASMRDTLDSDSYDLAAYCKAIGQYFSDQYDRLNSAIFFQQAVDILALKQNTSPLSVDERILLAKCYGKLEKYSQALFILIALENRTDEINRLIAKNENDLAVFIADNQSPDSQNTLDAVQYHLSALSVQSMIVDATQKDIKHLEAYSENTKLAIDDFSKKTKRKFNEISNDTSISSSPFSTFAKRQKTEAILAVVATPESAETIKFKRD